MKDAELKQIKRRLVVFITVPALLTFTIIIVLFITMVYPGAKSGERTSARIIERGSILDRNGKVLAIQTRLNDISCWTPNVTHPEETAFDLAEILGGTNDFYLEKLNEKRSYICFKKRASPTQYEKVIAKKSTKRSTENEDTRMEGIFLEPSFGRNYPEKYLASHLIGFVNYKNEGADGIEQTYNRQLMPDNNRKRPEPDNVYLTLDVNIQYFAEKIADKAFYENRADSVVLMAMDAHSGEILAWVSRPTYDPNQLDKSDEKSRSNLPAVFAYEPGSVFKIFTLAAALDTEAITRQSLFTCNGSYLVNNNPDMKIKCLGNHGLVDVDDILKYSCNVGTAAAVSKIEPGVFYNKLIRFGFGSPTNLPLPYEHPGQIKKPSQWSGRSQCTIGFGQELLTTPVQIISAATVFANDGWLLSPQIVRRVEDSRGKILQQNGRVPLYQVISPQTSRTILNAMEKTTLEGTAKRAAVEGINLSSKTGTAQISDPKTGKYSENAYLASCISLFPTEDPQIILYGAINYPKGDSYYGGRIVTPIIKELAEEIILYRGIDRQTDTVITHSGKIYVNQPEKIPLSDKVPNLMGKSKREVLKILETGNVKLKISGNGWVFSQEPAAGTPLEKGMTLSVELR